MKKRLLESMPHVALRELKADLQDENTQHDDEGIEDHNAVDSQDNDETSPNDVENINATGEAPATFQYGLINQERNDDLVARSQATGFLPKVFRRIVIKRYRNNHVGERSENELNNTEQHVRFDHWEISESDSEEDFQDEARLFRRTHRI